MTSYDLSAGGTSGAGDRLGHWGPQILIGSVVATIVLAVRPLPYGTPGAVLVPVALIALVLGSWVLMRQHDRRLCEHCLSAMPLDASATAVRLRRRLAVSHLGSDKRNVVLYLLVLIASNLLLVGDGVLPGRLDAWAWAAVQSSMIYLVLAYTTHRRLQPWCPQCSGPGDGRREDAGTPYPMPSGSA